jgi:Lipocalin-like domain
VNGTQYNVKGSAWLDRQWGNWLWSGVNPWTWMAMHLNNNVQFSLGGYSDAQGAVSTGLANISRADGGNLFAAPVTITPLGTWTSPVTHQVYSSGWMVRIPPSSASQPTPTVLRVTPDLLDQEILDVSPPFFPPPTSPHGIWEGACHVTGVYNGRRVSGVSWTELVGVGEGPKGQPASPSP